MALTVTQIATFRSSLGTHVRFRQTTLAALADAADFSDIAKTRGRYSLRPPSGSRTEPTLRITISLSMPVWTGYSHATDAEKEEWDRFYAALLEHEIGHYDRFANPAQAMYDAVAAVATDDMIAEAARQWATILADQGSYDTTTGHGIRQQTSHGTTEITPP